MSPKINKFLNIIFMSTNILIQYFGKMHIPSSRLLNCIPHCIITHTTIGEVTAMSCSLDQHKYHLSQPLSRDVGIVVY